jgi:inositol polyphosphate 5-phosphatase INPP5B/F
MEEQIGRKSVELYILPLLRHEYRPSVQLSNTGDHKPVAGNFDVQHETIAPDRYQEVHSAVLRELDKLENDARPVVSISTELLQFGNIYFVEPITRSLTLENTGTVCISRTYVTIGYRSFQFP